MSDNNDNTNSCQTKKEAGRPRLYAPGTSERVTFRLRWGLHDEILDILKNLPDRARSAWIVHALLCYVRGEIRDVERESQEIEEDLAKDLFGMWDEEDRGE